MRLVTFFLSLAMFLAFILAANSSAVAQEDFPPTPYSLNDFGGVGLLQTRTARFSPDGQFYMGVSLVNPFRRYFMTWQILPFVEVSFRYTDITNDKRSGNTIRQNQGTFFKDTFLFRNGGTNLDRSFDLKIRLKRESDFWPEIAAGLQDLIGTGRFSGEYLVASKRFGSLDFTLGMGWGALGSRGGLPNPLKLFGSRFDNRAGGSSTGGTFTIGNYFSGDRVSLFGGVEYTSPIDGLTFKFEFNGSNPDKNRSENLIGESFPINAGFNYRPVKWWEISMGWERGNSLMLRTSFRTNFYNLGVPKPPVPQPAVRPRPENFEPLEFEIAYMGAEKYSARAELEALYQEIRDLGFRVDGFHKELFEAQVLLSRIDDETEGGNPQLPELFSVIFDALPEAVRRVHLVISASVETGEDSSKAARFEMTRAGLNALSRLEAMNDASSVDFALITEITIEEQSLSIVLNDEEMPVSDALRATAIQFVRSVSKVRTITMSVAGESLFSADGTTLVSDQMVEEAFAVLGDTARQVSGITIKGENLEIQTHLVTEDDPLDLPENSLQQIAAITEITNVWVDPFPYDEPDEMSPIDLTNAVFGDLARNNIGAYALHLKKTEAIIYLSGAPYLQPARNIGWTAKTIANRLPADIEDITIVELIGGMETFRITLRRRDLERESQGRSSPEELLLTTEFKTPQLGVRDAEQGIVHPGIYPNFIWWLTPKLIQHIGDPDTGLYLADVDAELGLAFSLNPHITVTLIGHKFLFGSLDKIERGAGSVLPHVRSDIKRYLQEGRSNLARAQIDYLTTLAPEWYFRASAGLLENMFGGVGAEILYRPYDKDWALGADLNWVKQRDFDQLFDFRSYEVITGHASLYYEIPYYDMRLVVDAGRYLARDYGATIDLSRRFKNGIRVGAWATFTNVPFSEFGEGSFDKGFYISFPIELLLNHNSRQQQEFRFRPLSRDGGQKLIVGPKLYSLLELGIKKNVLRDWDNIFE